MEPALAPRPSGAGRGQRAHRALLRGARHDAGARRRDHAHRPATAVGRAGSAGSAGLMAALRSPTLGMAASSARSPAG